MNALERAIFDGAIKAQKDYEKLTDGWWIWHGPESFLQTVIAQKIGKLGHAVYIDASVKKVKADLEHRGAGRPAENSKTRADISVWNKSDNSLRAAIEVKRAFSFDPIRRDAHKLSKYLGQKSAAKTGYILAYSEAKGKHRRSTLNKRFRKWAEHLSWELIDTKTRVPHTGEWAWGFGLLRAPPRILQRPSR